MDIIFATRAWKEYGYWQEHDLAIVKKINRLIQECTRTPFHGTGKPEPLKGNLSGYWSRRISGEHRFVYKVAGNELRIAQCRSHY